VKPAKKCTNVASESVKPTNRRVTFRGQGTSAVDRTDSDYDWLDPPNSSCCVDIGTWLDQTDYAGKIPASSHMLKIDRRSCTHYLQILESTQGVHKSAVHPKLYAFRKKTANTNIDFMCLQFHCYPAVNKYKRTSRYIWQTCNTKQRQSEGENDKEFYEII